MKWLDPIYIDKWPHLWQLVQKGYLFHVEFAYATLVAKEQTEAEAAVACLLLMATRQGHLCIKIEKDRLYPSIEELIPEPFLQSILEQLFREGGGEKKRLYLPKYYHLETQVMENILRILRGSSRECIYAEASELTKEQNEAVKNALTFPLSLILGGPGTGKTYTAKYIVKQFINQGVTSIILAAPTGKAAAHLAEKIDIRLPSVRSGTLHSQLGIRSFMEPVEPSTWLDAEVVIVDECSMIDAALFAQLLASIGPHTHLVLMGDFHQLPSIEGGAIFRDLAESFLPKVTLSKMHRSERIEIIHLADSILQGHTQEIHNIDLGFREGNREKILSNLWEKAAPYFPLTLDPLVWFASLKKFRLLSTLRKGPFGVDAINAFFYEQFSKQIGAFPIIIRKNDINRTGLCNGDVGILLSEKGAFFADGKEIGIHQLPTYEYAYCLSVHMSQGSEYDHVLLLIPEGSDSFGREILYTAVTRAKMNIEVDGNPQEIKLALQKQTRRVSGISERLNEVLCAVS